MYLNPLSVVTLSDWVLERKRSQEISDFKECTEICEILTWLTRASISHNGLGHHDNKPKLMEAYSSSALFLHPIAVLPRFKLLRLQMGERHTNKSASKSHSHI